MRLFNTFTDLLLLALISGSVDDSSATTIANNLSILMSVYRDGPTTSQQLHMHTVDIQFHPHTNIYLYIVIEYIYIHAAIEYIPLAGWIAVYSSSLAQWERLASDIGSYSYLLPSLYTKTTGSWMSSAISYSIQASVTNHTITSHDQVQHLVQLFKFANQPTEFPA